MLYFYRMSYFKTLADAVEWLLSAALFVKISIVIDDRRYYWNGTELRKLKNTLPALLTLTYYKR
jgi:hypothetical protein